MPSTDRNKADADRLRFTAPKVQIRPRPDTMRADSKKVDEPPNDAEPGRLPPWRSAHDVLVKDESWMAPKPLWRRRPLDYHPVHMADDEDLKGRLSEYFEDCFDFNMNVTLSDMAAHAGYESLVQMTNDARRKGPRRMSTLSRALLAVQAHYEDLAQTGSKTALTILERIPQFDSIEAAEQTATRAFESRPDTAVVQISGMKRREDEGRELSPMDAYNQIIQKPTFQEIHDAIEVEEDSDGVFGLPNVEEEARR